MNTDNIKKVMEAIWSSYKQWPLWKKIVGVGFLVLILLLGILYMISKLINKGNMTPLVDALNNEHTTENIEDIETENKALEDEIKSRKKEIYEKINQAEKIDKTTLERRKEIEKATTMEELDNLQKEFNL